MGARFALFAALAAMLIATPVRADMHSDAVRLLAHRVRASGADPKSITVSGIVVSGNQALLSWRSAKARGVMGLAISADRWWDALDMTTSLAPSCWTSETAYPLAKNLPYPGEWGPADYEPPPAPQVLEELGLSPGLVQLAAQQNADVSEAEAQVHPHGDRLWHLAGCIADVYERKPDLALHRAGGTIHPPVRRFTSGYDITIAYSRNDAGADAKLTQLFARAPTLAEFAPNHPPAPGWGGPDAVCFFDIGIGGSKPVTFERGTTVDVWFPFVLDDQLRYNLSFVSAGKPSGMIFGTVFDNTLHFELPAFTLDAREPLMAEIDGDAKGPS